MLDVLKAVSLFLFLYYFFFLLHGSSREKLAALDV